MEKIKAYACLCSSTQKLTNEAIEKLNGVRDLVVSVRINPKIDEYKN